MSEQVRLEYHANYKSPPCVAMGEVIVCTFPVYPSDSTEMPDKLRHSLGRLFAASPDLLDILTAPLWLVWSNEHAAWWGPNRSQYYWDISAAGRYTLEEAMKICTLRGVARGDGINPPEMIQPAPEWLEMRAAALAKAEGP